MNQNWLIISYEPLASSLERYLHTCYSKPIEKLILPRRFFDEDIYYDVSDYNNYYEAISQKLCSYRSSELRHLVVLMTKWVDGIGNSSLWNPLHRHAEERKRVHPQEILLSWLVLSFPEVRWIFFNGSPQKNPSVHENPFYGFHYFSNDVKLNSTQRYAGYIPLFDPCGLRNRLRKILQEKTDDEGNLILKGLPVRLLKAAAIDEEPVYAYMNAYIAYRFGYLAWALIDWEMTEKVFGNNGSGADLVFEDLYLNFHDRPANFREEERFKECLKGDFEDRGEQHISHLKFRDCLLPGLKDVKERILVTVGHRKWCPDKERWVKNKVYLATLLTTRVKTLYKPFTGIFDLWKKAGKWKHFRREPRYADKFTWPPTGTGPMLASGGHSAPGQLLVLAHRLLDRAQNILKQAETVPEAIHAALLALEAKELLVNKTPTTAL
ncbi:MAG: hypothetical protein D6748_15685, partial [Calditrichaeota bacterium]